MRKTINVTINGCRGCPWAVQKADAYCGLSPARFSIAAALFPTLGGTLILYPPACPLAQHPALVRLADTVGKAGRPAGGQVTPGRDVKAESEHLTRAFELYRGERGARWCRIVENATALAEKHGLNVSHLRAAIQGRRPWHEAELDAVITEARGLWNYNPAEPADAQTYTRRPAGIL